MTTPSPDQAETPRGETVVKPGAGRESSVVQFVPGTVIAGRYRISGILGAGGMGEGILHRDLKPANVMLDSHGDARITDFGLARSRLFGE